MFFRSASIIRLEFIPVPITILYCKQNIWILDRHLRFWSHQYLSHILIVTHTIHAIRKILCRSIHNTYLVVRSTLRVMVALESYYLNITWIKLKLKIITLATSAYKADHNKITISFAEFLTKKSLKLYQKAKSVTITLTLSWMSHGAICFVI